MEIKRHSQAPKLHHHSLPIIMVALAIFIVSAPFVLQQVATTGNNTNLLKGLFSRPIKITHTSSIFVKLSLKNNSSVHIDPEISQAGRTTNVLFTFSRADP